MPAVPENRAGVWLNAAYRVFAAGEFDRRSTLDLRSIPDRRSPIAFFSSSLRVSTPLRRPLPERRWTCVRFSTFAMGLVSQNVA